VTCQIAVSLTLQNIRDWYASRKGTLNGIPVEHISANIVSEDYVQERCDEFIEDRGITLPANDYNTDPLRGVLQTNAVHDSFTTPFSKPLFVMINCVSNSPSHAENVLMLNQTGAPGNGTQAAWDAAFVQWRALIDSVQAPAPELANVRRLADGGISFTFAGQRGRTNQVLVSSNLADWTVTTNYSGTNAPITFRDTSVPPDRRRFYRLRRL
jgi:hypothetical protein